MSINSTNHDLGFYASGGPVKRVNPSKNLIKSGPWMWGLVCKVRADVRFFRVWGLGFRRFTGFKDNSCFFPPKDMAKNSTHERRTNPALCRFRVEGVGCNIYGSILVAILCFRICKSGFCMLDLACSGCGFPETIIRTRTTMQTIPIVFFVRLPYRILSLTDSNITLKRGNYNGDNRHCQLILLHAVDD